MRTRYTAIILCFLFSAITLFAQEESKKLSEMNLEDLLNMEVTTASKKAEKNSDAPGVITTITAEEIKYFGANSIEDILERATSIQPLTSFFYPSNVSVMRGDLRTTYDNHVLILINGRPVREGVTGGVNAPVYTGFPIDMIEKIEIIRGPGSVLYGSNAFVGVINIITKGTSKESSLKVKGTGGSFGTWNGEITGTIVSGDFNAKISTKIEDSKGWDYSALAARPGSPNIQMDRKFSQTNFGLAAEVQYSGLSLSCFFTRDRAENIGTLPYATATSNNLYERLFLNLGYTLKLGGTWDASFNFTNNRTILYLGNTSSGATTPHSALDYLGEFTVGGELVKNFNVIVGGVVESRNKFAATPTDAIPAYSLTQLSAYLQADYRPIESLKLIGGAQINKPQDKDWDLVPRVGAIYDFTPEIGLKTLYAVSFRSPWPTEQLINSGTIILGNKDLEPEKIKTLDVQLFYSSKKGEASITYYNSLYANSIVRLPLPNNPSTQQYFNRGTLHMNGLEFEGKVSVFSNTFVTGSATYQHNCDVATTPIYVPSVMGKIGAFVNLNENLTVGVFNTLFGAPKEVATAAKLNPEATAVDLVSVNVNYKLQIGLPIELNLYVQNLLNSAYNYTEFARGWTNTLPAGGGTAVYATVGVKF